MAELLNKIYYDVENPASFGGIVRLFNESKKIDANITKEYVENWLKGQDTYNLFRSIKRKFPRLQILVDRIDEQWQADLMDVSWFEKENDGIKYLLTVIDVLSRYAWVFPLKNKSANSVLYAFKNLMEKRKPEKLQTDQGTEFKNSSLQKFLKEKKVTFFTSTDDVVKCAMVERFNRTLRSKIYRYVYNQNNYRYIDALDRIVASYNNAYHRTIRMAPVQVNEANRLEVLKNIKKGRPKISTQLKPLSVGQYVRIARSKPIFEKGSTSNFSYEAFKISHRKLTDIGYIYKLTDLSGEEITSIFYREELVAIEEPKNFKIEKIVGKRVNPKTKKKEILVKWLGYDKRFNSWIESDTVDKIV